MNRGANLEENLGQNRDQNRGSAQLPESDNSVCGQLFLHGLCLPSHPGLTDADLERVVCGAAARCKVTPCHSFWQVTQSERVAFLRTWLFNIIIIVEEWTDSEAERHTLPQYLARCLKRSGTSHKLFPAVGARVISRSFRKLFYGLRARE